MENASRLWRIRTTVFQMLEDRGYVCHKDDVDMTFENFKQIYTEDPDRDKLDIYVTSKDDVTNKMFVFFCKEDSIGVKPVRTYLDRMEKEKVHRSIIVVKAGITPYAKQILQGLQTQGYHVEQFKEDELLVNITKHVLVPTHMVLNDQEKIVLLKKYKLKANQLPRIRLEDPVARYYGLNRSQVVKIIRMSETAGRYITYRLVV